jgi:hypothetical protein
MKRSIVILGTALVGAISVPAVAQQSPAVKAVEMTASAPGTATITNAVSISASVEAIDKAQRTVTLKGPKGNVKTVTAGPDVRNFDQIKVGDMVVVRYLESLTLTLKKDGKELLTKTEATDAARAKAGEKPAGIVGKQVEVTANVIAVDAASQTVMLKGPQRTVDLRIPDPKQFKLVKVGDQIQATYTEALALSVEPAKK